MYNDVNDVNIVVDEKSAASEVLEGKLVVDTNIVEQESTW